MLIVTNDGEIINTDKYNHQDFFEEETYWNGYAQVGRCSHMAYEDSRQYLYPKDDRYYLIELTLPGKVTFARHLSHYHAAMWLIYNNHRKLPKNLKHVPETSF
jgi:hypothetical protein